MSGTEQEPRERRRTERQHGLRGLWQQMWRAAEVVDHSHTVEDSPAPALPGSAHNTLAVLPSPGTSGVGDYQVLPSGISLQVTMQLSHMFTSNGMPRGPELCLHVY